MIVRHVLPSNGYTKIDKSIFSNPKLSNGAKVLYGYLCGLRNGANFCDRYLMKALGMSSTVLGNRKRELKALDLICTDQIGPRVHVIYIGHSTIGAMKVKDRWISEEES